MQQMPTVPALPAELAPVDVPRSAPPPASHPGSLGADVVFTVQAVQVLGATRFTAAELLAVAGFEAGQSSNLPGLQSMADRITRHYQQNGYLLARA